MNGDAQEAPYRFLFGALTLGITEIVRAVQCGGWCNSYGFHSNRGYDGENGGIGGNGGRGGNGGESGFVRIVVNNLHGDVMYRRIPGDGGHGGQNGVGKPGGQPGKDSFGVSKRQRESDRYSYHDTAPKNQPPIYYDRRGGKITRVRFIYLFLS